MPGTAIFLTADPDACPGALLHNLKHNRVLHENNLIITVRTATTPRVDDADRARIELLSADFTKVTLTFGYMEIPERAARPGCPAQAGVTFDIMNTSFFVGRRTIVHAPHSLLPRWQDKLFIWLTKNAADPIDVFRIPPGRVVEMGTQVSV